MRLTGQFHRLMDAADGDGAAGGGGGGEVTYNFGDGVSAEQAAVLTGHAKELGLSAEQAPKYAAHFAKLQAQAAPPEKYEFAKIGEQELSAEFVAEISETAKSLGLSQDQAQKLAAYELKLRNDAQAETTAQLDRVKGEWREQVKADPELGGVNLDKNLAVAKTALEKFFPDIAKNQAGFPFLDHPGVVKGLVQIGKAISPDGDFVRGENKGAGAADPAKVLFPGMA